MTRQEALNEFWDKGEVVFRNHKVDHCALHRVGGRQCFTTAEQSAHQFDVKHHASLPLALEHIDQWEFQHGR